MRRTSVVRFLTSFVIAALVIAGPLAPLAHAQQPAPAAEPAQANAAPVPVNATEVQPTAQTEVQPTAQVDTAQAQPAAPPQPAVPPPPPVQPDLFQEKLKAERSSGRGQGFYTAEAVVVNIFLVPGRVITCAAGGIVGVTILAVSLGTGYRPASYMFQEGCGGKWIVKGDDLRPDMPTTSYASDPVR